MKLAAGVTRQRTDCLQLASSRFPLLTPRIFTDNDTSAYTSRARPAWTSMLEARPSMVIAYNLDRLTRRPTDLEALIDLNIPVITAAGDLDLTTHDGQLQARILVAVARKSSDDTSRRVRRAARDRGESGRWIGGRVPYPYTSRAGVVTFRSPVSATLARAAVDLFLAGHSLKSLARDLSPRDPLAPQTPQGWRWVLLSPCLAALNTAGIPGQWQPIVTAVEHATLIHRLSDPSRVLHRVINPRERKNFLTGLLVCERCQVTMNASRDHRTGYLTYRCSRCGRTIHRARADAVVAAALFARAPLSPQSPSPHPQAESTDPAPEGSARASRLQHLATSYALGDISRGEWEAARAVLVQPSQEPAVIRPVDLPVELSEAWPRLDVADRHAIAHLYLGSVGVLAASHGRHLIISRLQFHWIA